MESLSEPEIAASLKLWVVLARAFRAVGEGSRRDIERHGLRPTEFAVLEALYHRGPLSLGDIAAKILLTSGSTTYVIDKLEERGLLERRACPEDRRVVFGELTEAGRAVIAEIFPAHARRIGELMGGLSPEGKRQATDLLRRLGRHAQERG